MQCKEREMVRLCIRSAQWISSKRKRTQANASKRVCNILFSVVSDG